MKRMMNYCLIGVAAAAVLLGFAATVQAEWHAGVEAFNKKDYDTAIKEFEEVTQTNPDYAGAYYMLGQAQGGAGKHSASVANFRKAVELDAANVDYKVALGHALIRGDKYSDAYTTLKSISLSSVKAQYRSTYALIFAKAATETNRPSEALSVLNAQISSDSDNAMLHKALGEAYGALGDDNKRYQAFKRAFDINSRDTASGLAATRAAILVARRASSNSEKSRYYTEAARIAERLAALSPSFEHTLLAGEAWLGAKDFSKALDWFAKAKEKRARNSLVSFYRGQCYSSLERFDSALRELQDALSYQPAGKLRTQIYNQMGYVYAKQRNYEKAKNAYSEAGNQTKVAEMVDAAAKQDQNIKAEQEQREFERKLAALRMQIEELRKIGQDAEADELQKQLSELEKVKKP